MKLIRTAALITFAFAVSAQAGVAGNPAAGKQTFEATKDSKGNARQACVSCHGPDANHPLEGIPKLAGQYPDYLAKALHDYQSGKRSNPIMGVQVSALTEADIANVTAYLGSLSGDVHDLSYHQR